MNVNYDDLSVYKQFIRDRVSELRIRRGVSESQMSVELNYSKGYIQSITSGRSLPSMEGFLSICDYCHITPQGFWETLGEAEEDDKMRRLVSYAKKLSDEDYNSLMKYAIKMSK